MWIDTIAVGALALTAGPGGSALLWALFGLAVILLLTGAAVWLRRARAARSKDVSEEACAVIIAVLCEELRAAPEELRIISIRRL